MYTKQRVWDTNVFEHKEHSHVALNVMTFAFQCFPDPDNWPFPSAFPVDEPTEETAIRMHGQSEPLLHLFIDINLTTSLMLSSTTLMLK